MIVCAVQRVIVGVGARAVDRDGLVLRLPLTRASPGARHEKLQLQRVAPVQRQLDDALGVHDLTKRPRPGVDLRRFTGHCHALRELAELHHDVHAPVLVDLDLNAFLQERLEAAELRFHGVHADRQLGDRVVAVGVRGGHALERGLRVSGGDRSAWYDGPRGVAHGAEDRRRSLRERGGRHQGHRQSEATRSPDHDVPQSRCSLCGVVTVVEPRAPSPEQRVRYSLTLLVPAASLLVDAVKPASMAPSGRFRPTLTVNEPREYTWGWKRFPRTRTE